MRPTIALLRAAAPMRLVILGAILFCSIAARAYGIGKEWSGSDEQMIAAMLVELGVIPVFAALLGSMLVRGEHSTWAWGLARPIARTRFALVHVIADLLLLSLAYLVVGAILGNASHAFAYDVLSRAFPVPHTIVRPLLAAIAYVGTAVGSARGQASLKALPVGIAYGFFALVVAAVVAWLDRGIAWFLVVDSWPTPGKSGLLDLGTDRDFVFEAELLLGLATIVIAVTGGLLHALVRGLARVPTPLARREILAVLGLWIASTTVVSWSLHSRLWAVADAPALARRGDASLVVSVDDRFTDAVVLGQTDCPTCFARSAVPRGHSHGERIAQFGEVEPGRYRLCNEGPDPSYDPSDRIPREGSRYRRAQSFESCIEIELERGRNEVHTSFDPAQAVPALRMAPRGYASMLPFAGLLVVRTIAEAVLDALRPDEPGERGRRGSPGFATPR
ncbi:MAG TPA: hypothetical protein VFG69_18495 [Nannocystaceae bacterium]|nr:hypothetical protein [Nannocystaceae bacterium]